MGTVPSVDPCLTLTGGIFTFRMKLTLLILPLLIGVAWGITADISPYVFRIKRAPQDVQPNTKIFTSNSQVNSAAAGALFGSLLSYGRTRCSTRAPGSRTPTPSSLAATTTWLRSRPAQWLDTELPSWQQPSLADVANICYSFYIH